MIDGRALIARSIDLLVLKPAKEESEGASARLLKIEAQFKAKAKDLQGTALSLEGLKNSEKKTLLLKVIVRQKMKLNYVLQVHLMNHLHYIFQVVVLSLAILRKQKSLQWYAQPQQQLYRENPIQLQAIHYIAIPKMHQLPKRMILKL